MRSKSCDNVAYVNRIFENLQDMNPRRDRVVYEHLEKSMSNYTTQGDCWLINSVGRSRSTTLSSLRSVKAITDDIAILTPRDPDFPGDTMAEALPKLGKKYRRVILFTVSGRGETPEPKDNTEDFVEHMKRTKDKEKYSLIGITTKEDSTIGNLARKYGYLLKLKGREAVPEEKKEEVLETGIMEDIFENANAIYHQRNVQMLHEHAEFERSREILEEQANIICGFVDKSFSDGDYRFFAEETSSRGAIYYGARGTSFDTIVNEAIRTAHVKQAVGDNVYLIGETVCPSPRRGDFTRFVSLSGGNKEIYRSTKQSSLMRWAEEHRKANTIIDSVIGTDPSPLKDVSKHFVVLKKDNNTPWLNNWFRVWAIVRDSPDAVFLCRELIEQGFPLSSNILRWYHSVAEYG
jgi:hypothetical protein